jgi:hypothetical protein
MHYKQEEERRLKKKKNNKKKLYESRSNDKPTINLNEFKNDRRPHYHYFMMLMIMFTRSPDLHQVLHLKVA